ncbi:PREDICTED: venom allergen 3-like [Dinoponera quadriceps]|uniref:Venom allergen 3 homolog n=1 Tax=Dinoponera quadriceps TaxID=609295 RepID=VA3_DINQU|nr:PREDICTED: venom allergen 3-like [Dinoponera quadriceps]P0DSI3.1 RecName: Full=Venom allergen 3 homolog; AltName: Full=Cysteine-rich venom protein; Short=CRVP; Flags: Precursor [Dinoponera quadriceps]
MSSCMLFFTVIIAGVFMGTIATNYCNLKSCVNYGNIHTMCKYTSSTPASTCSKWEKAGLTDAEKKTIVTLHNQLRRKVAAGKETRGNPGPQPAAATMPDLTWDNELAMVAQRWANQCKYGHDACRNIERFQVGQNVAIRGSTGENLSTVDQMILSWYSEVDLMNKKYVSSFPKDDTYKKIGHYTQIVYGNTKTIGCGRIFYKDGKWNQQYLVCNYGPAGNYPNAPVYQIKQ